MNNEGHLGFNPMFCKRFGHMSSIKIIQEIKDAAEYALESSFPLDHDLFTDVYL